MLINEAKKAAHQHEPLHRVAPRVLLSTHSVSRRVTVEGPRDRVAVLLVILLEGMPNGSERDVHPHRELQVVVGRLGFLPGTINDLVLGMYFLRRVSVTLPASA